MFNRITLIVLTTFWAVMMVLLWRAEFGHDSRGSLPAETVIDRMIKSPDDSSMIIYRRGQRTGTLLWAPNVNQAAATGKINSLEAAPEGQVSVVSEYTIDLEGAFYPGENQRAFKYDMRLTLSTNRAWRDLTIRVSQRPDSWAFRASALDAELTLTQTTGDSTWEHKIPFADLQRPEKVLADLGMPWATALLAGNLGFPPQQASVENLSLGLKWEASLGNAPLGKTSVRCYRLSARLFDRFEMIIYVSRVGELLRVELPDGYLLVNERWASL